MRNNTVTLILILFTVILSCRETDTIEPNFPPNANAGADRTVQANVAVVVDASASSDQNRDTLFYSWFFVSKPSNSEAVIEDANVRTTRFTPDMEGQYVLRLTVTDLIDADSDTLTVTAIKDNTQPEAIISNVPGGVNLGESFELHGENSTDPDGDDLTYFWEVISGPDGSIMTPGTPTAVNTTFVADKPGSYTIRLSVSDGTLSDQIEIEIKTSTHIITDINPLAGPFGATIKINGTKFSSEAEENIVEVNGMPAIVTSASHTSLLVVIPQGAGTGPITVTLGGITVTGPVFTYELSHVVSTAAEFNTPMFMAPDGKGNIYISDYDNHLIRRLSADGQLTIFAGNGKA
ncbi:MAG TPA: PKD domain-containing protein, partial [Chryseosolibacter sp.]